MKLVKGKEKENMKKITILGIILTFFTNLSFAAEVNVFSARHYDSDIQLYKKFTEKTGIKVNVVSGKDKALQKRITEEGADSKADIYITADAGRLGAFDIRLTFVNFLWIKRFFFFLKFHLNFTSIIYWTHRNRSIKTRPISYMTA